MNDDIRQSLVTKTNEFNLLFNQLTDENKAIWSYLVGCFRTLYVMDELWHEKGEMKFRWSSKTLVTLYLKSDKITALVIFGKAQRERFDRESAGFSQYINQYYADSKTFHDGKWMFIDVHSIDVAKEIIRLIEMKKKPNRKPTVDPSKGSACGHHCDSCLVNRRNIDKQDRRHEFSQGLAKCYGDPDDYSTAMCEGCGSENQLKKDCEIVKCAKVKGFDKCIQCPESACDYKHTWGINPGRLTPGLTAAEVTDFIIPYCNTDKLETGGAV